jgi:glycosyltransferase involved in cell wall biosynthesis
MRFLMLNWRDPKNPLAGGAERVSAAYLAELVRRGHYVAWFANNFIGAKRTETLDRIEIVRGGGKGSSIFHAIRWYRNQPPFDLVIDQHHGIPWYAPWWCKTSCVAYIHEILGPIWKSFYSWPLNIIGPYQERWTLRRYRNVPFWTPSESTKMALLDCGVRNISVFPNGTDAKPLNELEPKAMGRPVHLIAVSRLAPNKRVDHIIKATEILLRRGIEADLTIVGDGEMRTALKEMANKSLLSGKIRFAGSLSEDDKNRELRRAHFLIHASQREGWGLNVIEANAMGTPAIVYPVAGLLDSTIDGQTGLISEQEMPESLADCIAMLLGAPEKYSKLRMTAWERSKKFQWDQVLPQACNWLEKKAADCYRSADAQ